MGQEWTRLSVLAILAVSLLLGGAAAQAATTTVPATGQTVSTVNGDDGSLEKGAVWPTPRLRDNGDGTVTDNLTGLIWLQNTGCSGTYDWQTALDRVVLLNSTGSMSANCGDTSNEGSHQTDWRLPTRRELWSLIDFGQNAPALPAGAFFTGVQSDQNYWTGTTKSSGPPVARNAGEVETGEAWSVIPGSGAIEALSKTEAFAYAWPVRGKALTPLTTSEVARTGQPTSEAAGDDPDPGIGAGWPDPRFMDNLDGTVTDNLTDLIWLTDASCEELGTDTWGNALATVNNLAAPNCGLADGTSAGDWRLSNVRELESLLHAGVNGPALPSTGVSARWTTGRPFINVSSAKYWTGTYLNGTGSSTVWQVDLSDGAISATVNPASATWPVRDIKGRALFVDFGAAGLWRLQDDSWAPRGTAPIDDLVVRGGLYIVFDYGAAGTWDYDGFDWNKTSVSNADNTGKALVPLNGGVAVDYGAAGLWRHRAGVWTLLTPSNPDYIASFADNLAADFGAQGLWVYDDLAKSWSMASPQNADNSGNTMVAHDGGLAVDLGAAGLWFFRGGTWTQMSASDPQYMASFGGRLVVDFGATWIYYASEWTLLSVSDPDNNGTPFVSYDQGLTVDYGSAGLWRYQDGVWFKLSANTNTEYMGVFEGKLTADFGSAGLWSHDGNSWALLSASDANNSGGTTAGVVF